MVQITSLKKKFGLKKNFFQKIFGPKKIMVQKHFAPKIFCQRKKFGQKKFGQKNFGSNIYFLPNGDRLQCQHSYQKLRVGGLSNQYPMTFPTRSRPLVSIKVANGSLVQHMVTIPAWVGLGRLTCDYNAISVQLQLQLPTGIELGKNNLIR